MSISAIMRQALRVYDMMEQTPGAYEAVQKLDCGLEGCCMPGYHMRSECHTPEMIEAMENELSPTGEKAIFEFLCRKYVQRADDRQRSMGLQYMEAETHDLAQELAAFIRASGP